MNPCIQGLSNRSALTKKSLMLTHGEQTQEEIYIRRARVCFEDILHGEQIQEEIYIRRAKSLFRRYITWGTNPRRNLYSEGKEFVLKIY